MTNKELRDFGELYDANYDPELVRLMDVWSSSEGYQVDLRKERYK